MRRGLRGPQAATITAMGFSSNAGEAEMSLKAQQVTTLRMKLQPGICPFSVLIFWGKNTMPFKNPGLPYTTSLGY